MASGGLSHWVPIPKIDSEKPEDQSLIHILKNGRQEIKQLDEYMESRKKRTTSLKTGPVNEEIDRLFLQLIEEKDYDALRKWSSEFIDEKLGNGGQEIRNWLVLMGAVQNFESQLVCYEPIPEWVTGMGIVHFAKTFNKEKKNLSTMNEVSI